MAVASWRCWDGAGLPVGKAAVVRGWRVTLCRAGATLGLTHSRSPSRKAHEEGDGHGQAAARQDPEDPPEWQAAPLAASGLLPPNFGHHDGNPFNFQRLECTESCYKYFLI